MKKSFGNRKILILGFGCVGSSSLPIILKSFDINRENIYIFDKDDYNFYIAKSNGISNLKKIEITKENYHTELGFLSSNDLLFNASVDISSVALMNLCGEKNVLYMDTCLEPWKGGYVDKSTSIFDRSNYKMRKDAIELIKGKYKTTALTCHGANPGLVSHFVKIALTNIAIERNIYTKEPSMREDWAKLSLDLGVKVIQIAENDTQYLNRKRKDNEFLNTWSAEGFISEGVQPAEAGWGSHETWKPNLSQIAKNNNKETIIINAPGSRIRVQSWTPLSGSGEHLMITHNESISISEYLTTLDKNGNTYRPTCYYAYKPTDVAMESWNALSGKNNNPDSMEKKVVFDEVAGGIDQLGVLIMGTYKDKSFAYWFGSILDIHAARDLMPYNNATSLQISSSTVAGLAWCIDNPESGFVEADDIDHKYIFNFTKQYLGTVKGFWSDFAPQADLLFTEPDPELYSLKNFLITPLS